MKLCLVILLVATALAVPVPNPGDTQAPSCTDNRFTEGKSYVYSYESESVTGIVGTSERLSGLKIDCTVQLQVPEQCEFILTLQQCTLKELDPDVTSFDWSIMQEKSGAFNDEMVKYPLLFTMDGGKITGLEAHQAEPLHILNAKKGILSAFQLEVVNSTKSITLMEENIFGNCSVDIKPHYSESKDRIDYIVTEKDLTTCIRPSRNVPVPTLVEIITNFTLVDKMFESKQFCKHSINKRFQVDMIKCDERHLFRPLSYMDAGLQSNITQVIVLMDSTKMNSKPKIDNRESRSTNLVYEFEDEKVPGVVGVDGAIESLMTLVESTVDEVKMDTPRRFTEFVAILRSLSNETLHDFYPMAYNCSKYNDKCAENLWKEKLARQYIYDGLSHCVTQSCFSLINTMIANKEIDGIMAQTMLYTMAMQPYPTEVLIQETLRISKALRTQSSILTLSTMVHNYWVNNQEMREQRNLPDVLYNTMEFLKDIINHDCTAQSNELDTGVSAESNRQILLALKAIGNIGEPVQSYDNAIFIDTDKIISTLFRCAKNPAAPRNITLAAIQAFRRLNIRTAQLEPLKEILSNTNMDVEIRIATYLMIMRSSPAKRDLKEIIDNMRTEPVDQIRAFIGSHIQNVLESEEPSLESLRSKLLKILVDDPLPEYPRNILKYSRNIEFSKAFRLPYINKTSSSQFESNIIYNANAFLPRAAMFNTTLNVLGRSLYMVEFGIDMQGYEKTLEAIFGPQGYFPDVVLENMYKKSKDLLKFLNETYQRKSAEYGFPEKMEQLSAKADQVLEMAQPYLDMAKPYMDMVEPYVKKAIKKGKPIYMKAEEMAKPSIKKMKRKLMNLAESLPETNEPTESTGEDLLPNNIMMELDKMHAKVSHLPEPKYISIYLRAFENELGFTTVEEMLSMIPRLNVTNIKKVNMQMVVDVMKDISKKLADGVEINMTKSMILVQRDWVVPTSMGIPMNVSLNGTTSVAVRSLFRMKVDDIKKPMFIEGKFAPSAAVEVAGKMGVTLPLYGETGVLINATVYHSSSIAGNVTYKNGRVRFNLKNIKEPMNLFNFSTNFFLVRPDNVVEYLPGIEKDRSEYKFCTNVSRVVADDLCLSFAYPNASYAYAARFPLSGPMSFNITLVPTDSVEAFTMEASFRREKTSIPKKTFSSIGKSSIKPRLLRDIVHFNFSAPGKELTRNVSSLLVVDYQKTEVQWNFTVPEVKAFRIYAGILNLTDSEKNRVGYHLTYNISAAEIYNASNSLTLVSESDEMNTNCSIIFDTTVMAWRHTIHAQYLNNSGNWIGSLNETYYWDDDTPLYKQILWPFNDYRIKADKFNTAYVLVKSYERECEEVGCNKRQRVFETSLFRQNFTLNNIHTKKPKSIVNTLNVTFANDYLVLPIMNFTTQLLNKTELEVEKYEVTMNASRHERYAAIIHDITRIRGEYNHSIRFVYYSLAKLTLPQFDEVLGYPVALDYYGDALYNMVPSFMNTTIAITLRNETATMEEDIKPLRLLGYVNVTYPNPLNLHEQQSVSVVAKIANDTIYEDNELSYWMHFNTSVPHLQFETSYLAEIVKGQDGVAFGHNFTIADKKRVQNWSFGTFANWMPLTTNVTWVSKVSTPVLNISYDHVQFKNDGGFQLIFNDTVNNTLTDFLNHTVYGHFELKPEFISLNATLWTKMLQIHGTHVLRKQGPIVDFSLENVQDRVRSMYTKVLERDFRALYEETKVVSKKMIDSSLHLTNDISIKTTSVANMTFNNMMGFGITGLNNTVKVNITCEKSGLGANLFTNFALNKTNLNTLIVAESKSPIHLMQGNTSVVLFKSAPMEIGLESSSHMALKSSKGNASLNGTFFINSMKNLWSFKSVNGTLKYNISSPIFGAQLNSIAVLRNFISPFQFENITGAITHNLTSKVATFNSEMSLLLNDFMSIFNFTKIKGAMVHNLTSKWANASSVSDIIFHDFSSLVNFVEANATSVNQMVSKNVNFSCNTAAVLRNFKSAFNFELVNATMNHNLSTSIGNITQNSKAILSSFTDMLSFIEANATTVTKVSSKWVNANSVMGLIVKNVQSLFNFSLINGTMNHNVVSKLANLTSVSQVTMSDSISMWEFDEFKAKTSNKLASRLTNVSSDMALVLKNFRSIVNFSLVTGNMTHSIDSCLGSLGSNSQLNLVNFTNLFRFEHVNATTKNNITSRLANMTSDMLLLMKNFSAPLVFEGINGTATNNLSSKWVNVDSQMKLIFQDFSSLFNFRKVNSTMVHKLLSKWVNATSVSAMSMHNFTSPVSFTEANFTSHNNITSRVANLTTETDLHLHEFTSLFNFRKMAGSMKNIAFSRWLNATSESSVRFSNHSWLFKFDEIKATTKQNVSSPFTNLTSDVVLHLQNFRSIFNFEKITGVMKHRFDSRYLNATSNSSGIVNNHTKLFTFEEINVTTTNIVDSRWANLTTDALLRLQNFRSIFNFEKITGVMKHRFDSRYLNATSNSSGIVNNHTKLFTFEEINVTTTNIVDSRWANLTTDALLRLQNFRSIFNFEKITGVMKHRFDSRYLNATSNSSGIVNNHTKLFTFEEINVTTTNIVDSRWANLTTDASLRLQNFRSIFNFEKITGVMKHRFDSRYLNATSNSSGIVNNHTKLFTFEEINVTTTNIVDSRWANLTTDALLRLQNFRSIFNFSKVNGTMVHNFLSRYLNLTSNSSGIINNHARLFRFEEISGTSSNIVNSGCANLTSDIFLRLQNFSSIFNFTKVHGTADHKLDSKLVNATSTSSMIFHNFTSLFNFSEVNTTSLNTVDSSLVSLTSEVAAKLKNFRSIFNFDIISGLTRQSLRSRHLNFTTNSTMIVNNHEALFKFEEINASIANNLTVMSTNLTSSALMRFANFRSIFCFVKSAVSGNIALASKMVNVTSSNSFIVNQHHDLFNFDDVSAITDNRVKMLSTDMTSRMFFGLNRFKSIFSFNKIISGSNISIESRILNGTSNSSMMVSNHPALFVFDEVNVTTSNKIKMCTTMLDSDILLKIKKSRSFLNFKKFLTAASHGLKSQWINATSNSSMQIEDHRQLFAFNGATAATVNKINSSLMNVTSEAVMRLTDFTKVCKFEKVNGTMRHRVSTPILNISSESVIILSKFKYLFKFDEANATTSNRISSYLGNVTTFAGWRRIDSESMFKFDHMNTTLTMNVSLPVFVVATNATTDFVNFRGIFNFDKVNGSSNLIWNKCSFMNSTGKAEFALNNFRNLFDFTEANSSVYYSTKTKIGQFTSLTRGGLSGFRTPFNFDRVCMDTKNILTTPLVVFHQETGLTLANSTKFLKFDRFNVTGRFNLNSSLVNLTSLDTFVVQDMSSLLNFSQISMKRQYDLKSCLTNITLKDGIELHNFTSLFNFSRINTTMDYRVVTPFINASWISAVELKNFSSMLNFSLINANATVKLSSNLASFDHFSGLTLHNFSGSVLRFRLINGNMRNQIKTKLANLSTESTVTLSNFSSFFNFENANAKMSYNLSTPVVNSTLETKMDLFNFSSWKDFSHINISHNFTLVTKMINTTTTNTIHMTKWTVYQQRLSVSVSSPVAEILLLQTSDNQSVYVTVSSPKHGSLCFLGRISDDGKLMNMTVYHITNVDKLNVTDLQWLLMLNQSNVIYSNFSWNPALVDGAFNLTNDLIVTAVNITMTAVNQTKNYTRHVVNVTKAYIGEQVNRLNETYQNIDVITADLIVRVREETNKTILKVKEYAIQQWRNAKEFDYDDLWLRTVVEYERVKEDLKEKYAELKIKYNDMKAKTIEKYEELKEKTKELVVKIKDILKDEEHLINRLPMKYFEKTIFEIIEVIKNYNEVIAKIETILKDKDHPINRLPMKYFEKTIFEIIEVIKNYNEVIAKIETILKDKDHPINRLPMRYFKKSIYEIIQISKKGIEKKMKKVQEQVKVLKTKALEKTKIYIAYLKEKYTELKKMYDEFDREVFVARVREIVDELSVKARDLYKKVLEKATRFIEDAKKKLDIAIDEAKVKLDKVIDEIVVMSKNESNRVNRLTLRYLDRTVYAIAQELVAIYKDQYAAAMVKLDIYKEKAEELLFKLIDETIVMSLNESYLINKYALKYTGRNINRLVKESIENLTKIVEKMNETALEMYQDAKVKYVDYKAKALEKYEEYKLKAMEKYDEYKLKAMKKYDEYKIKAVEKYTELRERLQELYEALKIECQEYYDYAQNKTLELKEKLSELKKKFKNQPLNISVRETMEYVEEVAEKLRIKVDELTAQMIQFYEENITEENIQKFRRDAEKYIEDRIQPLMTKLENITEHVSLKTMEVLENQGVLELTEKFVEKTREYLNATRAINMKAIESAQTVINITRDSVESFIEYLNNTLPGWIYRYYEINQIPLRVWDTAVEVAKIKMEQIPVLIRMTPELTLNLTRSTISYSLNSIGQVGEHSFAMNISHPLNYTSFYKVPTFTNKQWERIYMAQNKTKEAINQVILYYNETRQYINETYPLVIEWVKEQEPILREKYEKIREKVEILRDQAIEKYDEWKLKSQTKYDELKVKVDKMIEETKEKYEEIKEKAKLKYNETKEMVELKYKEYYPKVVDECKRVYGVVRKELPNWRVHLKTAYNVTKEELKILQELFVEECKRISTEASAKYEQLQDKYNELKPKYEEIKEKAKLKYNEIKVKVELKYKEYYPKVVDECKRVYGVVRKELPNWRAHLKTAYNVTKEELKILQELFVEECKRISTEASAVYEQLQDKYNELKVSEIMETVKTKLENLKLKLKDNYKKLIALIKKEFPNWRENLDSLTDKMYLKFDELIVKAIELIEKIKEKIPEIEKKLEELVSRVKALTPDYIKNNLHEIIEYIKEAIEYLKEKIQNIEYPQLPRLPAFTDIIPPFQSTGMIFGPLHVYTFDQKRYEFPGYKGDGCTYVLASDFVDRNFTIVSTQDTVTLLIQEMSIKVNSDNKVQINGRNEIQELPYQSSGKEVTIVRNGQWVEIATTYGLDIKCDAKYAICLFNASHWYYNKTLGLLGTLNEEKHFDMRKPDGNVARDLTDFANSYEVSGSTKCKIIPSRDEIFSQGPRDCTAEPSRQCKFLFTDSESPFAKCFDTVKVTEFITLCEEETKCYPQLDEAICNATVSYVEMCRSRGRHIEHAQECNKCGDKVIGEIWETKSTRSADIVMIVSENRRMAENHDIVQALTQIVETTDRTLKKASINDNIFSIVAFGGADIHKNAHQHTINGKAFASSSDFISGAQGLAFYGDYETESLEALKLATELELREEATKIFILVVEEETDAEIEEQLFIQSLLKKNGITLNVISSYEILKKTKTSKNIVGINWDGRAIMSSKSEKDTSTKLDVPRGSYAKLAKASKGAVFSLDQLRRQVDDVIVHCAKRIRNEVERPLDRDFNMKECNCERNIYGRAVSKCEIIAE